MALEHRDGQEILKKHAITLPFSLLSLAYFAILADARIQEIKIDSVLKPRKIPLSLKPDVHYRFRLFPSGNVVRHDLKYTDIYLQWVPKHLNSAAPIALLSSNERSPVIRFKGERAKPIKRNCSQEWPCFEAQASDEASFFAKPGYAFLKTTLSQHTRILLYRKGGKGMEDGNLVISPRRTKGRTKGKAPLICGGRNGQSCTNHGECKVSDKSGEAVCSCKPGRTGRFCEDALNDWTSCPKMRSSIRNPVSRKVKLAPNTWAYYKFVQPSNCALTTTTYRAIVRFDKQKPVYVVIKPLGRPDCSSNFSSKGYPPSLIDREVCGVKERNGVIDKIQRNRFKNSIFGFYSEHSTEITWAMQACANPECASSSIQGLHYLILPICLCILCVAAAIVCVLLYVDRRHGIVTGPDKLSETELGLMCPAYTLETLEDPEHAEHKTCSICISEFQVGDSCRRLKCDHRFHSACIDPWLTLSNASCPTCREEARIPELSERRIQRAIVKHVLAPMLRLPLRARRRRMSSAIPALWRSNAESNNSNDGSYSDGRGIPYCADEARASYTENTPPTPPGEPTPRQSEEVVLDNLIEQTPSTEPTTWESEDVILPNYSSPLQMNDGSEVELSMPSYSPPTPPPEPTAEEMAEEDAANAGTFPDRIRGAIFGKSPPPMDVISDSSSVDTSSLTERGISNSSFYTEPPNFDMTELQMRGVLPHVRENLQAPINEPTFPEPIGKARERRDSDE